MSKLPGWNECQTLSWLWAESLGCRRDLGLYERRSRRLRGSVLDPVKFNRQCSGVKPGAADGHLRPWSSEARGERRDRDLSPNRTRARDCQHYCAKEPKANTHNTSRPNLAIDFSIGLVCPAFPRADSDSILISASTVKQS